MSDQEKFDVIIDQVCKFLGMTFKDVRQPNRHREICEARHYIFHFARQYTGLSLMFIGKKFGKDHATVVYGDRLINDLNVMPVYRGIYNELNRLIRDAMIY